MTKKEKQGEIFKNHVENFFINNSNLKDKVVILNLIMEGVIRSYKSRPGCKNHDLYKLLKEIGKEKGKKDANAIRYLRVMRNDITHMNPGFNETLVSLRGISSNPDMIDKIGRIMDTIDNYEVISAMYVYWILLFPDHKNRIPILVRDNEIEDLVWF